MILYQGQTCKYNIKNQLFLDTTVKFKELSKKKKKFQGQNTLLVPKFELGVYFVLEVSE